MDQLYEITFSYYLYFFSLRGRLRELKFQIFLITISGLLFIYCLYDYITPINNITFNGMITIWDMKLIFVAEAAFLLSLDTLKEKRTSLVTHELSAYTKKNQIIMAKRKWIKDNCDITHEEYFNFVEKIIELNNYNKEFSRNTKPDEKKLIDYIYSSDSKARITSYIIFMLSMIFILSAKDISSLSEILPYLEDNSYINFIKKLMILATLLFIISIGVIQFTRLLITTLDAGLSRIIKIRKGTDRFINIFILDLIKMHRLPAIKLQTKI